MSLRSLLTDGQPHVFDGAMGSLLYERGIFVNVCYDELSRTQPEVILGIHRAYVDAGAELLETNTFGANPVKLSPYGLEDDTESINESGARLARTAARRGVHVVGAIGPLGIRIEPWGPTSEAEAEALFGRQVDGLLAGGVDGLVLETFSDLGELVCAVRAVRARTDAPLFAHATLGPDGRTSYGATPAQLARGLTGLGVDAVGLNCSLGPAGILDGIEEMAEATDLPLSAMPNAGAPRAVGDRKIYMASTEYVAQYARRLVDAGASFVGGCCGTTPEHVRAIRDVVDGLRGAPAPPTAPAPQGPPTRPTPAVVLGGPAHEAPQAAEPIPLRERSTLGRALAEGGFLTMAELIPAAGWDTVPMLETAQRLQGAGADVVTVLDRPTTRSRVAVVPAASIVQRELSLETVIHYTCRDRNMHGMISDLLGAAASGVHNLLLSSGDPRAIGHFPHASAVFDIDSIGLTNVAHQLNRGLDPGGGSVGGPARFVIGVVAKPTPVDPARERERFRWKVEAGAEYAVSQPVFDGDAFLHYLDSVAKWPLPTVLGVYVAPDLRTLEFVGSELPGIRVPNGAVERMRAAEAKGPEAAEDLGLTLAREVFEACRDRACGISVAAPAGRVDLLERLLRSLN